MTNQPTPEPRIARFEEMRFGLQMHWGLYSLLGEGEWIMHRKQIPPQEYNLLAKRFTAEDWDPRAIARLCKDAGMRYATLTTRHHDGFSLYDTRGLSDFDAPHSAAGRDLVAEFVEGCRAEGVEPFFYHTTLDWQWQSQECDDAKFDEYLDYLLASVEVLCKHYGPVLGFGFDGNWSRKEADWKEGRLYSMIRSHQPEAIIINNPGMGNVGYVSHPEVDAANFEQHGLTARDQTGDTKYRASRMSQTLNSHWGIGHLDLNYKSPGQIIETLAKCVSVDSTYILNVGPTASGAIPELDAAILRTVGKWTHYYQAALYGTKVAKSIQCPGADFVAEKDGRLYYFVHRPGISGDAAVVADRRGAGPRTLTGLTQPVTGVRWLGSNEPLEFQQQDNGALTIHVTGNPYGTNLIVRVAEIERP